ncbi:AAA family ATPase [Sinorhizobium medicae]|uniref:AAA family ATPase n=1 Tax=Sinorhizobium medicae TaxID=110321 RepID=A0A6G1WQL7_9HYPH|nr:AAA family ATPase [Sinorhizobium medicae]MQW72024.1 AAA family ATPase [Sinorhizobium medicae]MQX85133.1 AAA family ATPase [Sinorhizobium medicae]
MIEQISISNVASYAGMPAVLSGLRPINFIFGSNGSGKTTISRIVARPENFPGCRVSWEGQNPLECLVYNRDFIVENFTSRMRGIFTLGHEDADILKSIDDLKKEIDDLSNAIRQRKHVLEGSDGKGGKKKDLADLNATFQDSCWKSKVRHEGDFREAFRGLLNSRANFAQRMYKEFEENQAQLKPLEDLVERASTVFAEVKAREEPIAEISASDVMLMENAPILDRRVVGKEDVSIADMIKRLGNSDWVKQGLGYFHKSGDHCPFCQQQTDHQFRHSLEEYFDETYQQDIDSIATLARTYAEYSESVMRQVDRAISATTNYLDRASLELRAEVLGTKFNLNNQHIEKKRTEPSSRIELDAVGTTVDEINAIISDANQKIASHNALIDNIVAEREALTSEVWRYVVDEASIMLNDHKTVLQATRNAINGLSRGIEEKEEERRSKEVRLRELERQVTSVQPTVNAINGLLDSFGFRNFKLATARESDRFYTVIRSDGSEAGDTLSEGEKTFIVFLYFFYLIDGSVTESGITTNRVVVIDDPVSSLDSDVLFIVSSLIKKLFLKAQDATSTLKQVFVLTHNIYFHKEVSFDPKRSADKRNFETFWVVRKKEDSSIIEGHPRNPIRTSYEMLWEEVRNEQRSTLTIQNTLRRIVENYFTILGNMDKDEIVARFSGHDQQICNSLFSWINDGSHNAHEDLYVACDATTAQRFLSVFRSIFEVTGHLAHYEMMIAPRA